MRILHFISHTHWDREWHEPFQIFRLRLADVVDKALDLLASDPGYKYFMLDGQTIVLEDYAEIEPGRAAELRAQIQAGRVLVGPWYVLPDEFLVSGEALVRNLQRGIRIAREWGRSMAVGYIPDPFGHISQMPQILAGFGLESAMFRRGLSDEPTELRWEGADGTPVLVTYLRDGYDNAAWLPRDPDGFARTVAHLLDALAPHAVTDHVLMMHGTDHMAPWEGLPQLLRSAEAQIGDVRLVHSNLEEYAAAVRQALTAEQRASLCVVKGELRDPKRHHLLPGVASARMWIKQRNARAQMLLERWAEPLAAIGMTLPIPAARLADARPELSLAWKYLLQNHPHDSICGCSIDQVHREMVPRFDWTEQIGNDVAGRGLDCIVRAIETRRVELGEQAPVVVLNHAPGPRTDLVTLEVDLPEGWDDCHLVDESGATVPHVELGRRVQDYMSATANAEDLRWTFGAAQGGSIDGRPVHNLSFRAQHDRVDVDVVVSDQGDPDPMLLEPKLKELAALIANPEIRTFHAHVHSPVKLSLAFVCRDVPAWGYRTLWLVRGSAATKARASNEQERVLENEYLRVEVDARDGTLTVRDKTTGSMFAGLNNFVDGGDRGDLYNYCPPEQDRTVTGPTEPPLIELLEKNAVRQILRIRSVLRVPASLASGRDARSEELVDLPIATLVTLVSGARRLDFQTKVENRARDHRLRVEFPTPIQAQKSFAAQAFDIVAREIELPQATREWVEQPRPEKPMQGFVAIGDERTGAVLAARGLPEYEARPDGNGTTLALTLLRAVGWLSRPDLACRRGDAGPEKQTPEAQEPGTHFFEYSFIPYAVASAAAGGEQPLDWHGARAQAISFNVPLRGAATGVHDGPLAQAGSWVENSNADFVITAVKPPETGQGLIVRGFNAGLEGIQVLLRPYRPFARCARVDLNEEAQETLAVDADGRIRLGVRPREIVTLHFED